MNLRMMAAVLLAAWTLAGCSGAAPTVPPLPTETTAPAVAAGGGAGSPAEPTPPGGTFPPATESITGTVPAGADQPAIEPGPGTAVPEATIPPGADQPAIELGPGTPIPGSESSETAPATELAPDLAQVIRDAAASDATFRDAQFGSVAIEDYFIRVELLSAGTPTTQGWIIVRAAPEGYTVVWGPATALTAAEAQQAGIPAALIP